MASALTWQSRGSVKGSGMSMLTEPVVLIGILGAGLADGVIAVLVTLPFGSQEPDQLTPTY
jgi:hypothetical protein